MARIRAAVVAGAAAALVALPLPSAYAGAPVPASTSAVQQLLAGLNSIRRAHGLPAFRLSPQLTTAATRHAESMGRLGYFGHDFAGVPFGSWIGRYYPPGGRSWAAGENILWGTRPLTPARAIQIWMHSPGHRENILRGTYREIGIGAVDVDGAPGVYAGLDVTIAVTDFGARS